MPGKRIIENKRVQDQNIMKNRARKHEEQEVTLPPSFCRTFKEREALAASLEVFIKITQTGLKLPGRNQEKDEKLLEHAQLVLARIS